MASTSRPRADDNGSQADARSQDGASLHAGDDRSEDGLHADDEVASSSSDQIQAVLMILAETQRMMAQNQQGSIQKARSLANVRIPDSDGSEITTVRQYREWRKNVDIIKRLNKNMHGDDSAYYRIPDDPELAAQYLLLYEFSLPFGLDLGNQINIDKSSTRFFVAFEHLDAVETRQPVDDAHAWLATNAPGLETIGVSPAVMFAYIADRNIKSMFIGMPVALIGISFLLILALASWKMGLLSLIPNLVPLGLAFGVWGLIDGKINFTMAIVLGMTVGIVVDDTIHFLSKYLRARRELGQTPEQAVVYSFRTVGTALTTTSLILVAGFAVLAQSAFLPNSGMAQLTSIAIICALIADFFLLPALLLLVDRDRETTSETPMEDTHAYSH